MWSKNGFTSCEALNEGIEDREERFEVPGRDIAALAFVPAGAGRASLPSCALTEIADEETGRALDLLIQSGNPEPALAFSGPAAFAASLKSREYRGALVLSQPKLWLNRDGTPVRLSFRTLEARLGVGYAPTLHQSPRSFVHGVGAVSDRSRTRVRFGDSSAVLVHWQHFLLGSPAQLFGRFPRAQHAPYAWIKVSYRLSVDGRAEAHLASSYLPSVWFYLDYRREAAHDMLDVSVLELERFLLPEKERSNGTTWLSLDASTGQVHKARS